MAPFMFRRKKPQQQRSASSLINHPAMIAPFKRLPTELIEEIVTQLDVRDISSLRSTCRDIERKASYGTFTQHFKAATIDLDRRSLRTFVDLTQQGGLGTHLQRCNVSGTPSNYELEDGEYLEHLEMLTGAFANLKRHSPRKALLALVVKVSVLWQDGGKLQGGEPDPRRSWRQVWKAAAITYRLVTAALHASGLTVQDEFDVFGSLGGCSLSSHTFIGQPTFARAFTKAFGTLKTLRLSLSAPLEAKVAHSLEAETRTQVQTRYSTQALLAVQHTLRSLPLLQVLEVHWYQITRIQEMSSLSFSQPSHEEDPHTHVALLPKLEICVIRGFFLTEQTLLSFLTPLRATSIHLFSVTLVSGTFAPIFAFMMADTSTCKHFRLSDLFEPTRLLRFSHSPSPTLLRFDTLVPGPTSFDCGADMKVRLGRIHYQLASGVPKKTEAERRWSARRRWVYGPPVHDYALTGREVEAEAG